MIDLSRYGITMAAMDVSAYLGTAAACDCFAKGPGEEDAARDGHPDPGERPGGEGRV